MLNTTEGSMKVAREWARYHIGDASWANDIIWAYEHPAEAMKLLNEVDTAPEPGYTGGNNETTEV